MGNLIEKGKEWAQKIPEFSSQTYVIVAYVISALVTIAALFLVYEAVTTDALFFGANWNMFKSPLGNFCWIIGFFWAMLWWGKFTHWSATPIIEKRDRYTDQVLERKENMDITEQMFAKMLMPIIGHFVIEPIMYGAIIYYPIQCIIAIVGGIFPYVLSIIVLAICGAFWVFGPKAKFRYRSLALVAAGLLFAGAFGWGAYAIISSDNQIETFVEDNIQPADSEAASYTSEEPIAEEPVSEDNEEDQIGGNDNEGLLGSLAEGTTIYVGEMAGFPIEFTITKEDGSIKAVYKNVKYSTTMQLIGESLPAAGGDISFMGKDPQHNSWTFELKGNAEEITGAAMGDNKELPVTLHKK